MTPTEPLRPPRRARTAALLLAGGYGTRLLPLTRTVPKCLIEIGERRLIDYWVESLLRAGVHDAVINTHHLPERVREHIAAVNDATELCIHEAFEPELLGSAGTVSATVALADRADTILLVYADNLSSVDLSALLDFHAAHDLPGSMLLFRTPRPRSCGIVSLDADGTVIAFEEKPEHPRGDLANAGVYVFSAALYREVADMRARDLGHDVFPSLVGRLRGFAFDGYHRDIGTPESLAAARDDVQNGRIGGRL